MSILGILLLCFTLWPLGLGILIAIFLLGGGFTLFFGYKVIIYMFTAIAFFCQTLRSSVFEPVTIAIRDNISKSFKISMPASIPEKAIYCWHPHGLFAISPFIHCCFSITSWNIPVSLASHSFVSSIPLIGFFLIKNKIIPVNEEVIKLELDRNRSICLVPGGVRESFEITKKKLRLVLKNRKGMFRIAIDQQVPLVPILVFGENDLFTPIDSQWHKYLQEKIESVLSFQFPIPSWNSVKKWFTLLNKPFDTPIETFIGEPLYPEKDDTINTLKEKYINALNALYSKHKPDDWAEEIEYLDL